MSNVTDRSLAAVEKSGQATSNASAASGGSSAISLPCVHCGEPTLCPEHQDVERVFCCNGCAGAYDLIRGWGLEDFYALRDQSKLTGAARAAGQASRYEQFDAPEYLGASAPTQNADGTCTAELAVHGLHCGACAWLIENAALRENGLLSARVKMSQHTIQLVFDPGSTKLSQIASLLDRLGYQLAPFDPGKNDHLRRENRRHLTRIAIAGFLAANAMWIAVALYAGEATGVAANEKLFLVAIGTALGVSAVVGPGRTFLVGAWAALKTRTPHMDLPVALGLSVGAVIGVVNAVRGMGNVYFDSLATLVFLLLIGRWIQFRQQQRATQAVDLMLRLTPRHAELQAPDGSTRTVLVDSLVQGDTIYVSANDSIPADGNIVSGETRIDRSLLTGESVPVAASVGDVVAAGTVNLSSPISVRVSAMGRESRIGKVLEAVESASTEKTPIVMLADRIGGYFVIAVLTLACITFALWARTSLQDASSHATALLIVACPCALALATPLAIAVGLGRAARSGILIRDGSSLQQLSQGGHLWLDKTGTLTEGRQRVASFLGSVDGFILAASLETQARHPIATALVAEAKVRGLALKTNAVLEQAVDGGVAGTIDGKSIVIGNATLMHTREISPSDELNATIDAQVALLVERGESPLFIAADGQIVTLLGITDPIRAGAQEVLQRLSALGWKIGMLSGDHADIASRVGGRLGIPPQQCHGGLSPEDKLRIVRESRAAGETVAMIGDGANDAAALAAADVGVAVRGGAEVSLQAAPIFIATGQLQSLVNLIVGSRRTTRLIWSTFAISLTYNIVAVALALAGWISPLIAAVLMPISSASVLAVTLAYKTFETNPS